MALGIIWTTALLGVFVLLLALDIMGLFSRKNHFGVDGRTILLTGGSQGMGRALGRLLAQKGANVVIVARNKSKLAEALEYISSGAKNSLTQRFHSISADVTSPEENDRILSETTTWNNGQPPDIVWANAGSAHPGLFIDTPIQTLRAQMDIDYWASAYLAHSTLRLWLRPALGPSTAADKPTASATKPRHFIMTSSVIAFVGMAGYTPYAPAKTAMRSLADTLRSEVNLYNGRRRAADAQSGAPAPVADVNIHCVFPATITTPGFEEEEKIKHPVTKILEADDPRQSAEEVATAAIKGLEAGGFLVTTSILGHAMRVSTLGGSPRNNWFVDTLFSWATSIAWLFIGPDMEGKVFEYGKQNPVQLPSAS